jgi:hypothetical protein
MRYRTRPSASGRTRRLAASAGSRRFPLPVLADPALPIPPGLHRRDRPAADCADHSHGTRPSTPPHRFARLTRRTGDRPVSPAAISRQHAPWHSQAGPLMRMRRSTSPFRPERRLSGRNKGRGGSAAPGRAGRRGQKYPLVRTDPKKFGANPHREPACINGLGDLRLCQWERPSATEKPSGRTPDDRRLTGTRPSVAPRRPPASWACASPVWDCIERRRMPMSRMAAWG